MYYVYMIRCEDNSLYTGITSDLVKRMKAHFYKKPECAKYTKSHQAVCLEVAWSCESRSEASRLEYAIKRLSKSNKEKLSSYSESLQSLEIASKGMYDLLSRETILKCMDDIKKERLSKGES